MKFLIISDFGLNMAKLKLVFIGLILLFFMETLGANTMIIDDMNRSTKSVINNNGAAIPNEFELAQNFPNPFNPVTTFRYQLPKSGHVKLSIYDMRGRAVMELVNSSQSAGSKSVQWNATDSMGKPVSTGVYLYQIEAGEFVQTRKMVLLK